MIIHGVREECFHQQVKFKQVSGKKANSWRVCDQYIYLFFKSIIKFILIDANKAKSHQNLRLLNPRIH